MVRGKEMKNSAYNSPPDKLKAGIAVPASIRKPNFTQSNSSKGLYQDNCEYASLNMAEIAPRLLGDSNKRLSTRTQLRYGNKGSLSINIERGIWLNFESGEGGGVLQLVKRMLNCDNREAWQWVNEGKFSPPPLPKAIRPPKDNSQAAKEIWQMGKPIAGTLAETYLNNRGIIIDPGANVLRFIKHCPFGRDKRPCMVALYRDIFTDEITGIHRTALTPDGQKIDRKMLGRSKNAAIKLTPDENVTNGLGIAEGIETALTVIQAGWSPVWAMGSATGIANFPILPAIEALTILADNDPAGLRAAKQAAERWKFKEVYIRYPERLKTDFNDYVGGN
tara:strand:- start:5255 stop:6259 length:1005 start_codon:yes stop_codon:yes gene_type:complete